MANKTNFTINGQKYFRLTKTVGRKLNENGKEVPVRKQFLGKNQKEAQKKYEEYKKNAAKYRFSLDQILDQIEGLLQ